MPAFTATDAELMDEAIDGRPTARRDSPSALPTDRATAMTVAGEPAVLFGNVWPRTPSGKVELASTYLDRKIRRPPADLAAVPVDLPAGPGVAGLRQADHLHVRRRSRQRGDAAARDAPRRCPLRGLRNGARVRVWNDLGEIHLPLRITGHGAPGVVATLKGTWMRTSDNAQTVSALCPTHHADISEGACFNDARVEVAAL